jgi:restriction endonuclease
VETPAATRRTQSNGVRRASIVVPDHLCVPGLEEPLSASEYAKLEGLDENDVLETIHRLGGVYSLGWYVEAPPYSEERFSRLRAESKLEPRLLNWLQRRADLHDNPQYKSEVERLRVHFIKSDPRFDRLPTADQSALINTREYAKLPEPIDYGLSRPDVYVHGGRYPLNDDLRYREEHEHGWGHILLLAFLVWVCACGAMLYLHDSGQLSGTSSQIVQLALVIAPVSLICSFYLSGIIEWFADAYRRRRSNPGYLRYREALQLHNLYKSTAQAAAREAEQAFLRKKRSYWEFLNGYAFERATAEVLKRHQFNPIVTRGSADGGIDIEVTRGGLRGVVQCKAHVACVGPHVIRDLYGVTYHSRADFGIIVSRGGFSQGAIDFARDKPILFLDVADLIAMQEGRDVLAAAFSGSSSGARS